MLKMRLYAQNNGAVAEYGDEQYDKLILKCTGDGLDGEPGYNVDDLILNANIEFVP